MTTKKRSHHKQKPIIWDGDSKCFSDLRYSASAGGVFATFSRDGSQYFFAMSRADAKEWLIDNADDPGGFFNEQVR